MVIRVALLLFCLRTDGPGAGGPPGNCRQHGFGLFSRLSSASVMRATTLSTSFVRSTAMWIPALRPGILVRRMSRRMHKYLRHDNRNSRCHHAGYSCATIPAILADQQCGPTMCPPPMCGPPQCAPQPITKCKPASYGPRPMPYGYAPACRRPCANHDARGPTAHCFILHGTSC